MADRLAGVLGGDRRVQTADRRGRGGRLGFHNAIVSRWPIEAVEQRRLPGPDGRPGHRRILLADVRTPWGPWPFASTHLDYQFDQSATRLRQMATVARRRGRPARRP